MSECVCVCVCVCVCERERERERERESERARESLCLLGTPHSHTRTRWHRAHSFLIKITLFQPLPYMTQDIPARKEGPFSFDDQKGPGAGAGFIQSKRIERARWTLSVTWVRRQRRRQNSPMINSCPQWRSKEEEEEGESSQQRGVARMGPILELS